MKRKFLILTLCFTIIFSSLNLKKSYALDFVISPTMLAVVSTLAVGTGVALKNADDIYDIGRMFYDYVERNNSLTWDIIKTTFEAAVALGDSIKINSGILDICKNFFDDTFGIYDSEESILEGIAFYKGYPDLKNVQDTFYKTAEFSDKMPGVNISNLAVGEMGYYSNLYAVKKLSNGFAICTVEGDVVKTITTSVTGRSFRNIAISIGATRSWRLSYSYEVDGKLAYSALGFTDIAKLGVSSTGTFDIPYTGGYDWDSNVEDKKEGTGDLLLPIPGDLNDLIGKNPSDVWDKNYQNGLVGSGDLSIPNVNNPSISLDDTISFPNTDVQDPPSDIPDVNDPPIGGIIPPFPSFGDSLDFSPMYLTNINEKFPFSLPWDIGRLIEKFDVEPKAPIFKVPIVTSDIELDLTIFDEWANIVRFFILIGFALSLILISTKLLG